MISNRNYQVKRDRSVHGIAGSSLPDVRWQPANIRPDLGQLIDHPTLDRLVCLWILPPLTCAVRNCFQTLPPSAVKCGAILSPRRSSFSLGLSKKTLAFFREARASWNLPTDKLSLALSSSIRACSRAIALVTAFRADGQRTGDFSSFLKISRSASCTFRSDSPRLPGRSGRIQPNGFRWKKILAPRQATRSHKS